MSDCFYSRYYSERILQYPCIKACLYISYAYISFILHAGSFSLYCLLFVHLIKLQINFTYDTFSYLIEVLANEYLILSYILTFPDAVSAPKQSLCGVNSFRRSTRQRKMLVLKNNQHVNRLHFVRFEKSKYRLKYSVIHKLVYNSR